MFCDTEMHLQQKVAMMIRAADTEVDAPAADDDEPMTPVTCEAPEDEGLFADRLTDVSSKKRASSQVSKSQGGRRTKKIATCDDDDDDEEDESQRSQSVAPPAPEETAPIGIFIVI